jgi:hypothetical protein
VLTVAVNIMIVVVCGHDVTSLYVTQMQLSTVNNSVTHSGAARIHGIAEITTLIPGWIEMVTVF